MAPLMAVIDLLRRRVHAQRGGAPHFSPPHAVSNLLPVVVVPGGERQVDRHRHRPPAYGGGSPLPLGRRRRLQYFFF